MVMDAKKDEHDIFDSRRVSTQTCHHKSVNNRALRRSKIEASHDGEKGGKMSSVQKVREKVLQLARDIEKLSQAAVPPDQFFAEFLRMIVTAVGARGGAVWLLEGNRLGMIAELGIDEIGLKDDANAYRLNEKLLIEVMQTGEACTYSKEDNTDVELPTDHLLVLSALHKQKECVGVVQLFQRPDAPREARPGYLQFLEQMCGYASNYIEGKHRVEESPNQVSKFWLDFEQFSLRLKRSLDSAAIADTSASDGRMLLGCDRLSVVTKSGRKVAVQAVSGQTSVNPRSNLIRAMAALSGRVIKMNDTLTYSGKVDNLPPQIEKPLANLVQESTARMIMLVPLFPSERLVRKESDEGPHKKKKKPKQAFGCLVVENMQESQPSALLQERVEVLSEHIAASMWNARRHNRIFLRPVWTAIGGFFEWFHGRKIAIAGAVVAAAGLAVAAMTFVPWDYRVEADGKLMPIVQQAVFSPWEGRILPPDIKGGDRVQAGDTLLQLENERLQRELLTINSDIDQKTQQLSGLEGALTSARQVEREDRTRPKESYKLYSQWMQVKVEISGLGGQKKNIESQLGKLTVTAPISGIIPDLNIEQELMNRPVQAGQLLFHIMDDRIESGWHLVLKVEGKRIGHIEREMKRLRDAGEDDALTVEFIPATSYDKTFTGKIKSISATAMADQELGSVYEVIVTPDDVNEVPNLAIRTEVSAKINCGERSLGYVLFGDVIEAVQKLWW